MTQLTISYEEPYKFVVFDGITAIRKFDKASDLLTVLSLAVIEDIIIKPSAFRQIYNQLVQSK